MIRVAINGYGRIGRVAHRVILEKYLDQAYKQFQKENFHGHACLMHIPI